MPTLKPYIVYRVDQQETGAPGPGSAGAVNFGTSTRTRQRDVQHVKAMPILVGIYEASEPDHACYQAVQETQTLGAYVAVEAQVWSLNLNMDDKAALGTGFDGPEEAGITTEDLK